MKIFADPFAELFTELNHEQFVGRCAEVKLVLRPDINFFERRNKNE